MSKNVFIEFLFGEELLDLLTLCFLTMFIFMRATLLFYETRVFVKNYLLRRKTVENFNNYSLIKFIILKRFVSKLLRD